MNLDHLKEWINKLKTTRHHTQTQQQGLQAFLMGLETSKHLVEQNLHLNSGERHIPPYIAQWYELREKDKILVFIKRHKHSLVIRLIDHMVIQNSNLSCVIQEWLKSKQYSIMVAPAHRSKGCIDKSTTINIVKGFTD